MIRVFVAPGCPHCAALLADFEHRCVRVEIVDLGAAPDRLPELLALTWQRRLPVIVDHERCSVGFCGHSTALEDLGVAVPPGRR